MGSKKKIGFIFIDGIHHISHFITVATALAKENEVSILTFPAKHDFLRAELDRLGGKNVKIEKLFTEFFTHVTEKVSKKKIPRASVWMKKHRKYIAEKFDAVVFSDFIHHKFAENPEVEKNPPIFILLHGIPGRAYAYKEDLRDFDFQFLLGSFHKKQFEERNLLTEAYKVIGYPKLDTIDFQHKKDFFNNHKPTVVYSPHFIDEFSSWHKIGKEVLEYFYNQTEYNLIFAPHIQLFNKRKGLSVKEIDKKYYNCKHIHIDSGSQNSVDMTYTKSADIYLGDVSSQVYEFIIHPRPCIFLNTHDFNWKENSDFRFWKSGDVIESVNELKSALKNTQKNFEDHFKKVQEEINDENFYTEPNSTASERAASAILEFLEQNG